MGENCVWGSSACVDAMGGCCLLGVGVHCVIASEAKQATVLVVSRVSLSF